MSRKRIIIIIKWAWLVAVLGGAGWYVYRNYQEIGGYLSNVSIPRLLLSILLLIIGKLILGDLTRFSLKKSNCIVPYKESLTINSVTQLGNYLPGGIWHFAGKFSVYKLKELSVKDATRVMVIETFWLFSSAALIGISAMLITGNSLICNWIGILCNPSAMKYFLLPVFLLWITGSYFFEKILYKERKIRPGDFALSLFEQIVTWLLLGLSFWMVFPSHSEFLIGIIGAFSISWLVGYAAVFAPGGIGIRELMLALILGSIFTPSEVSIYATIHRLIWVVTELLLGAITMLIFGMPLGADKSSTAIGSSRR